MPVIALKGISLPVKEREMMSVIIIKTPPKVIQRGIDFFVFLPEISLTMWGMTNPIQEIEPAEATLEAVNKVAIPMIKYR